MQSYATLATYITQARSNLQDLIEPYRYADSDILVALNTALSEMQRIRPDMFLDLKYQQPQRAGNIDDGAPPIYTTNVNTNIKVPIPAKYFQPIIWYISGFLQIYDVTDTQDQRAQAFMQKFQQQLMTVTAA